MINLCTAENGVKYYKSDKIIFPHGFSTRIGGVSRLPHTSSLNLAFGRGDDDATVLENLEIFAAAVGFGAHDIISVAQIHSADVRVADKNDCGAGYYKKADFSCDGYVTRERGVALGVKTADCVPILLSDNENRVIGALHAGWRGTFAKITEVGVQKMCELGADRTKIKVAIGACIGKCCYEVSEDFFSAAKNALPEKTVKAHIIKSEKIGKYHADLRQINAELLIGAGILPENIDISEKCTCCEPEVFFSHRASGGIRGTMCAVIEMP